MPIVSQTIAILATAVGVLGSLCLLVLCVASAPNSTPALAAQIKFWAIAATIGGILSLAGAITCMILGRPWTGAIIGVVPMIALVGVMVYAQVSRSWPMSGSRTVSRVGGPLIETVTDLSPTGDERMERADGERVR